MTLLDKYVDGRGMLEAEVGVLAYTLHLVQLKLVLGSAVVDFD